MSLDMRKTVKNGIRDVIINMELIIKSVENLKMTLK